MQIGGVQANGQRKTAGNGALRKVLITAFNGPLLDIIHWTMSRFNGQTCLPAKTKLAFFGP